MSQFLAVSTGLVSSVQQATSGPGITIGGIGLSDMEVPEKLTWGGTQQLVVHRMLGGQRVIDAMGPDDRTLDFGGLIRGPTAVSRARQLDAMRTAGAPVILSWDDFTYKVVIQSFEADYTRQGYRVPYRISCLVIPQPPVPVKPSLLQAVLASVTSALKVPNLAAVAQAALLQAQQIIQVVTAALPVAGGLVGGSAAFRTIASAVGTAGSVVGAVQSAAEVAVGAVQSKGEAAGNLFGGTDGLTGIASLQTASASTTDLASSTTAVSHVRQVNEDIYGYIPGAHLVSGPRPP